MTQQEIIDALVALVNAGATPEAIRAAAPLALEQVQADTEGAKPLPNIPVSGANQLAIRDYVLDGGGVVNIPRQARRCVVAMAAGDFQAYLRALLDLDKSCRKVLNLS